MGELTITRLRSAASDDELYDLLAGELGRRLLNGRAATDGFVNDLCGLPRGLRAMGATYELDASLALDDLGWHFGSWHHIGLAEETLAGLRELEAGRMTEIFAEAFVLAQQYWRELGEDGWSNWYHGSTLELALTPLNAEAWDLWKRNGRGLFKYWLSYARKYPERVL